MNNFSIINRKTGELWKSGDWECIPEFSCSSDGLSVYVKKAGLKFDSSSIFLLKKKKKKKLEPICHPHLGVYLLIFERRIYTKMYQVSGQIEFSNEYFYAYWHRLVLHIEQNTGIIFIREKKGNRIAKGKSDLIHICKSTQAMFYKFWKECLFKKYVMEIHNHDYQGMPDPFYVVNPVYAINGNKFPQVLMETFYPHPEDSGLEFIALKL